MQETRVQARVDKMPQRREWQPTPVFFPGEFRGQRSQAGYSPWGHKELDTTEQLAQTQIDELGHWLKHWGVAVGLRDFLTDAWDQGDLKMVSSTSPLSHQCSPRQPSWGLDNFY